MLAEQIITIGIIMLFISLLLIIIGSFMSSKDTKFGFGGFIGPIPFGFANDPRMLWFIFIITIVILILFVLPLFRGLI